MENLEGGRGGAFRTRVLGENLARVTDVRGADVNGDGRMDLIVGQFGYVKAEFEWMENLGHWQFRWHRLLNQPRDHRPCGRRLDRDGRIDFAAMVSQDAEAVRTPSATSAASSATSCSGGPRMSRGDRAASTWRTSTATACGPPGQQWRWF